MNALKGILKRLLGQIHLSVWASLWGAVVVALSIMFFTAHMIEEETEYAREQTKSFVQLMARGLATSMEHAWEVGDSGHGLAVAVESVLADESVLAVQLIDETGAVLLLAGDKHLSGDIDVGGVSISDVPEAGRGRSLVYEDRLVHWHPIAEGGRLGWVRLDYDLAAVDAFQKRFFADNVGDGLIVAGISGVLLLLLMWMPLSAVNRGIHAASTLAGRRGKAFDLGIGTREVRDLEQVLNETSKRLDEISRERGESADLLTQVLEKAADGIIAINAEGIIQTFNGQAEKLFGYTENEVLGKNVSILMPEPYRSEHDGYLAKALARSDGTLMERRAELTGQRKDGSTFPLELGVGSLKYQGEMLFIGTVHDITDRREYERAMDESHRSLLEAQQLARLARWEWDIEADEIHRDADSYKMLGMDADLMSPTMDDLMDAIYPEDREVFRTALIAALEGEGVDFNCEYRVGLKDESTHIFHAHGIVRRDDGGVPVSMVGTVQDISDRRGIEDALRRSEKTMAAAQRIAGFGSWQWDIETGTMSWSDMACEIYGVNQSAQEPSFDLFRNIVHPEDRGMFEDEIVRAITRDESYSFEHRLLMPDDSVRMVREVGEIVHNDLGRPSLLTGTMLDITDYRAAEAQKEQAQKMAAVGQLASGIAHEFNNLLVAIGGFARMAQKDLGDAERVAMCLEEVITASERADELTDQLLTFSRRREAAAKVVEADEVVGGLERLLGPVLGAKVKLKIELSAGDAKVKVDSGQTAQAIMNLAINARDAMPKGGDLTIRTWVGAVPPNIRPGENKIKGPAVCISVSDTGTGIDPKNLDRLFEPFFTTKEEGKGTGLGLSMVYGTASEAGGFIDVKSVLGEGTTFYYYLPVDVPDVGAFEPSFVADEVTRHKDDNIRGMLVVEDDPAVAQLATMSLEEQDYFVFTAETGEVARNLVTEGIIRIDLAVIDIELPGINGIDLAQELSRTHPGLKILLMSGMDMAATMTGDDGGVPWPFLKKPFTPEALQDMVHQLLNDEV